MFFLSGDTWYEVFWTAPAGNPYDNLAHQYMAARLNVLDGASVPASVAHRDRVRDDAVPDNTRRRRSAPSRAPTPCRQQFVALAGTLGSYNEGRIGPGDCDE